jgi:glyoxylase-like metal-dependent hydrolase (beta-lactamase superfamily II)
VGSRNLVAIVGTHAHNDHVNAAPALAQATGAVCLYAPDLQAVFTGDTLFQGGPGATGRSYSDFPTIVESIRKRLLMLPPETVVHTGHGARTSIGAEAGDVEFWLARGH